MAEREHRQTRLWTVAVSAVVGVALLMAGMGMVMAIRQTQTLARQRIADARPEAQLVVESVNAVAMPELSRLLNELGTAVRHGPDRDILVLDNCPGWIRSLYMVRAQPDLVAWDPAGQSPTGSCHWVRRRWRGAFSKVEAVVMGRLIAPLLAAGFDETNGEMQLAHDVVDDEPLVLAYSRTGQGLLGSTVVAASIDVQRFVEEVVSPRLPSNRIKVETIVGAEHNTARNRASWMVDVGPLAPFVMLTPTEDFVDQQGRVVLRQTVFFVAGTALAMAALLALVWASWRVLDREIALSKMKQAFVADVSHELKTPLALIRLFAETLRSGRVNTEEKRLEYYEIITRESDRLTHLINNILDFSRIDAGKKRYTMEPDDVGRIVRETYEAYRAQLDHEGFEHQLVVDDDLPEIHCDRDAVAQALINLITNAVKYTENDKFLGIDVTAETRRGGPGVLISVSDRGIGIKPEDRDQLFSGFYRAEDPRVRQRRGAGLGLALVKHIVDGHGGVVDVESRLVKGSTFRIFLPANHSACYSQEQNDGQNTGG